MHRITASLALAGGLLLLASSEARPEDGADPKNHVAFEARVEPERVGPGGKGTLVLEGKILPKVHVYADGRFTVVPLESPGVSYEKPQKTEARDWTNPDLPDDPSEKVWFDRVEVRIPFTLDATASDPAKVGASLKWSACDDDQCFAPERQSAEVLVRRPEGAPAAAPGSAGAAPTARPAPGGENPAGAPAAPSRPTLVLRAPDDPGPAVHKVDDEVASIEVRASKGEVTVTFAPKKDFHLYVQHDAAQDIVVEGRSAKGLSWSKAKFPIVDDESGEVHEPMTVRLPFEANTPNASGTVRVEWTGCHPVEGCKPPQKIDVDLRIGDPAAATPPVAPPSVAEAGPAPGGTETPAAAPAEDSERGVLFPVIGKEEKSYVQEQWERLGLLILGPIFLIGLLLAFTPCVLPIIPITVSIIGGGRADLPRSRLTILLVSYVLGLSAAFGSLGLVAALTGASISAAFESPVALWIIAGIFVVLALGMFGIYELQPPAWLQRVQGQRKGGSIPAAFLFGALAAVIASPCTGPVIAAMLLFTAQGGNEVVGFLMFFTLGLGMGAVFFAAGALNFVMRPGPWMVWVRYVFGVLLVGVALYYLGNGRMVSPTALFVLGFGIAVLVALGIARHLVKTEGEAVAPAARRGAKAAVLVAVATGLVAVLTRPAVAVEFEGGFQKEAWITLRDRAHLKAEVDSARGHPVVVDTTADWCTYCHAWEAVIAADPELRRGFSRMKRLQIDVTDGPRLDLRSALGVTKEQQPYFVFLDAEGRILRRLDLGGNPDKAAMAKRLRELGVLE